MFDNFKISRAKEVVPNVTAEGALQAGAYVTENFDDVAHPVLTVDLAPTADTSSIKEGFDGKGIAMVSAGNYAGFYLTAPGLWEANATYTVEFDYKVEEIAGALYIKSYAEANADKQLDAVAGQIYHGTYTFESGSATNVVLQFFPNAAAKVVFDNFKITRSN